MSRRRNPKGQGAKLADEILDATERLLVAKGTPERVSVRAIAAAVGVTPPSLYLHFEDKDALFVALAERRFVQLADLMTEALEGLTDPVERLAALGAGYVRFGVECGPLYAILFGPSCSVDALADPDSAAATGHILLRTEIAHAAASGAITTDDVEATAATLWAATHGVVMLCLMQGDPAALGYGDPIELGQRTCHTMMYGLLNRAG